MNPRVKSVRYIDDYTLLLIFMNDEKKQFSLTPYLGFPVYAPLKDESFCKEVKVKNGTVYWNGDIDFDPDTLYLESSPAN